MFKGFKWLMMCFLCSALSIMFLGEVWAQQTACYKQLGRVITQDGDIIFDVSDNPGHYKLKIYGTLLGQDEDYLIRFSGSSYRLTPQQRPLFGRRGYHFIVEPIGATADSIDCLENYEYDPVIEDMIDDLFDELACLGEDEDVMTLAPMAGLAIASGDSEILGSDQTCAIPVSCESLPQPAADPTTGICQVYGTPCEVPTSWIMMENCPGDDQEEEKIIDPREEEEEVVEEEEVSSTPNVCDYEKSRIALNEPLRNYIVEESGKNDWAEIVQSDLEAIEALTVIEGLTSLKGVGELCNVRNITMIDSAAGALAGELGNLEHLTYLEIADGVLSGSIPAGVFRAPLQFLILRNNDLTGEIPSEIGNLGDSLMYLHLEANNLSGILPQTMANLTRLQQLHLNDNAFEGQINVPLGVLSSLESLMLTDNQFDSDLSFLSNRGSQLFARLCGSGDNIFETSQGSDMSGIRGTHCVRMIPGDDQEEEIEEKIVEEVVEEAVEEVVVEEEEVVGPLPVARLQITGLPATITLGDEIEIMISAHDTEGNVVEDYAKMIQIPTSREGYYRVLEIGGTPVGENQPARFRMTPDDKGITNALVRFDKAGFNQKLEVQQNMNWNIKGSIIFDIMEAPISDFHHFEIIQGAGDIAVGKGLFNFKLAAVDASGDVVSDYSGQVTLADSMFYRLVDPSIVTVAPQTGPLTLSFGAQDAGYRRFQIAFSKEGDHAIALTSPQEAPQTLVVAGVLPAQGVDEQNGGGDEGGNNEISIVHNQDPRYVQGNPFPDVTENPANTCVVGAFVPNKSRIDSQNLRLRIQTEIRRLGRDRLTWESVTSDDLLLVTSLEIKDDTNFYSLRGVGELCNLEHLIVKNTALNYIPQEIGHLPKLKYLDISQNKKCHPQHNYDYTSRDRLTGVMTRYVGSCADTDFSMPREIFNAPITDLYIQDNPNLTGPLPPEVINLKDEIRMLALARNNLIGDVPVDFDTFPNLGGLILHGNNFNQDFETPDHLGDVPDPVSGSQEGCWYDLMQVSDQALRRNIINKVYYQDFYGLDDNRNPVPGAEILPFPHSDADWEYLWDGVYNYENPDQRLSPHYKAFLGQYPYQYLRHGIFARDGDLVRTNQVKPKIVDRLKKMTVLGLNSGPQDRYEFDDGLIALDGVGQLCNLERIEIKNNAQFTQGLPDEMSLLTKLNFINVSDHDFVVGKDQIPDFIGDLPNLSVLQLNNNYKGAIPSNFVNLDLTFLSLEDNQLTGTVQPLAGMDRLQHATLCGGENQLTYEGNVPQNLVQAQWFEDSCLQPSSSTGGGNQQQ